MELLSRNPDVVQVHDAFSDAEVSAMSASNSDSASTNMEHLIEQRLEALTGLQTRGRGASNEVQLLNHLPGGHIEVHVDSVCLLTESRKVR